ncbi:MAG: CCA tRNA nucleotidyltransferase [archaeon]
MNKLYKKVLAKITPAQGELVAEKKLVEEIRSKINKIEGKHSHLEWCGSSARGTHLRGDRDLDLFVMFDKDLPAHDLEKEGLRIGKAIFRGHKWEMAYSQHPYIRGNIKGFDVEIVPSYIVPSGAEKQSAVDRTPFHNKYLLEKFSEEQKQEARLLKQFLKGINAYGADLKNNSLPGYGVELLIAHYSNFENAIKWIAQMKPGFIVDFGSGEERAKVLFKKENYPLIIIDPVDENRNVASALSIEQFERIVLAAKLFLKTPDEKFFFPKDKKPWTKKRVRSMLAKKELIAIQGTFPKGTLPDIVWGQLRRFEKKARTQIHEKDFVVLRSDLWSDEKKVVLLIELEELNLQKSKKIKGPMASDGENAKRFLEKKRKILSGPRVEEGRIVLEIEREETRAKKILEEFIKTEKREDKKAIRIMLKSGKVLEEKDLIKAYKGEFAKYLSRYLEGKEVFE